MKYLRYWWRSNSTLDPQDATGTYYRVRNDALRRPIVVEEYDQLHQLVSTTNYAWKFGKLAKTHAYGPTGELQFYHVYKYGLLGNLKGVEKYRPDGTLVRIESSDL